MPLTTNLIADAEPLRFRVLARQSLCHDSNRQIDQLRAIDNRRLLGVPLAQLDHEIMKHVAQALHDVLELN